MECESTNFFVAAEWGKDWPSDYRDYRLLDVVAENEKVRLVPYSDKYFDLHFRIRLELYPAMTKMIDAHADMKAGYRRMILEENPDLKILVFDRATNQIVGEVVAQPPEEGVIELGWDILPEHQRRGYAKTAVGLLMGMLERRDDCNGFSATIEADNTASKALARKLGGVPRTTEMTLVAKTLREDDIERFKSAHAELLTEEVIEEAYIFGVDPETLLTHALVFSIPGTSGEHEGVEGDA